MLVSLKLIRKKPPELLSIDGGRSKYYQRAIKIDVSSRTPASTIKQKIFDIYRRDVSKTALLKEQDWSIHRIGKTQ